MENHTYRVSASGLDRLSSSIFPKHGIPTVFCLRFHLLGTVFFIRQSPLFLQSFFLAVPIRPGRHFHRPNFPACFLFGKCLQDWRTVRAVHASALVRADVFHSECRTRTRFRTAGIAFFPCHSIPLDFFSGIPPTTKPTLLL